ncbi:MAG TPA: Gfo/Idh/MocA family oxidoreductase, partial [Longilinea sp.]|nr:Gfo/Idh/MocA family oxidoreductase [Longilinea sp.]
LHLDTAIPAAEAGCHILMEKPVSDSLDGIADLKNALQQGGGSLLVGFQYRFHPSLGQVKKWVTSGEIGRVISFRAEWGDYLPDWHPWEDYRQSYAARKDLGGGVVRTLCHPLDYLRWIFGEASIRNAFVGKLSDLELDVDDHADVQLKFDENVEGTLHLDYYRKPGTHRLEVFGTNGMIEWKNETGAARIYRQEIDAWETYLPENDFERNTLFINEMKHFLAVSRGEEPSGCTLEDGLRVQELVEEILHHG